ncbi:hypothetical protein H8E06_00615 [bacterium]|nr:hypothetical protein [bacterium]
MNSEKIEEFNSILDTLDSINESSAIEFYVPSLKRDIKFSPITITHQHNLNEIEIAAWNAGGAEQLNYIYFCKAYDGIIKETCLDKDLNTDTLLSIDRLALAIQHRIQIDKKMKVSLYEDDEIHTVDLSKLPIALKKISPAKLRKKIKHKDIQVTVGFPSLNHDRQINDAVQRILDLENESAGSQDEVEIIIEENFADLLLTLLSKHIVEIDVNGKIISIDKGASPDMFISIIQKLPLSLLKKVNDSYEDYKAMEAEIITIKHTENEETTDILLDITTGLFTGI